MNVFLQALLGFVRRNPFAIASGVLSVLLWVGNYFIWTHHKELTAGHESIQRSGEDLLSSLTNHARISAELATVKDALAQIDRALVNEGELPENMGYFYQLENSSRLHLDSLTQLSSLPPPPDSPYKTVPFTLRTTGTYRQVMRFLRELESGPRLFRIQTYSLSQAGAVASRPGEAPEATPAVTLELNIEMLARP